MNKYLKTFLHRGLMFGGFGPIITAIVIYCTSLSIDNFSLSAYEVLFAVVSTYLLAFIQAGSSVFNQIEHWSIPKSTLCHFSCLYVAYTLCYMLNSWIPFKLKIVLIYTAIFIAVYLAIWIIVVLSIKISAKRLNNNIRSN